MSLSACHSSRPLNARRASPRRSKPGASPPTDGGGGLECVCVCVCWSQAFKSKSARKKMNDAVNAKGSQDAGLVARPLLAAVSVGLSRSLQRECGSAHAPTDDRGQRHHAARHGVHRAVLLAVPGRHRARARAADRSRGGARPWSPWRPLWRPMGHAAVPRRRRSWRSCLLHPAAPSWGACERLRAWRGTTTTAAAAAHVRQRAPHGVRHRRQPPRHHRYHEVHLQPHAAVQYGGGG